jgi:hypothetical protein
VPQASHTRAQPSPKFLGIRETGFSGAKIHAVRIRQQVRPQFGPGQLSTQLDRLDNILDGLSDAIPATIAEAVQQGVRSAIVELMKNPELLKAMQPPAPQPAEPQPQPSVEPSTSIAQTLWSPVAWVGQQLSNAAGRVAASLGVACSSLMVAATFVQPLLPSLSTLAALVFAVGTRWLLPPLF